MNTQRRILLGLFFMVALSILAVYTLFLTDIHLFSDPITMRVYFEDANNLREGDPVQLLGARIGRVKEVSPLAGAERKRRILTVLSLDEEIELLEDARIEIRETSLLGGRHVFIEPGTFGGPVRAPLEDGGYLGQVHKNPIASFGDFGAQLSALLEENKDSIRGTLKNLEEISADIRDGKGLLGKVISDPALAEDVRTVVSDTRTLMTNVSEASTHLKEGKGLAGALIYDESMRQQFADTLSSLRKIGADLESQQGLLGALIYDSELRAKISRGIDSFVTFGDKLNASDGALGLLLSDKETAERVRTLVADLSAAAADVKTLVAGVEAGNGTIGKLLKEEGVYQELQKALGVLTRSLEDYREAAPITSFTSVLFGAF